MEKEHACSDEKPTPRTPCNKGKLMERSLHCARAMFWSVRTKLQIEGRKRDLALFILAIDSKLRGCRCLH